MTRNAARFLLGLTVIAALVLSAFPAMATPVQYTLNLGNNSSGSGICGVGSDPGYCPGGKVAPPYATVTLNLSEDMKSIGVSVQLLGNGQYVLWGGKGDIFAFNYTGQPDSYRGAPLLNVTSITAPNTHSFDVEASRKKPVPSFGKFDYVITSGTDKSLGSTLSFTVTRKDNGVFSKATDIATGTYPFAMEMANCATCSGRQTGFAGGGTPVSPVPEPATLALLGTGLITLGGVVRRFRK